MKFKHKVLVFESNKELRLGSDFIKGIFDGQHYFKIIEQKDGELKF